MQRTDFPVWGVYWPASIVEWILHDAGPLTLLLNGVQQEAQ